MRSVKPGPSNPRASNVDAQARVPPLSRWTLQRGAELFLEVERLVAARRTDDDVQCAPLRLLERGSDRRSVAMDVDVGVDALEVRFLGGTS